MIYFLLILAGLVLFEVSRIVFYASPKKLMGKTLVPYSQHPENPSCHILFAGDSFLVGTGATDPTRNLVGILGRDMPTADITNHSVSRLNIGGLIKHLKQQHLGHYDLAVLMVGGIDIVTFSSLKKIKKNLEELVEYLKPVSKQIVFWVPSKTGDMPLYSFLERDFLNYRAARVHEVFEKVAASNGCLLIDQDPNILLVDRKKYFFTDLSHPNDAGYEVCYEHIKHVFSELK